LTVTVLLLTLAYLLLGVLLLSLNLRSRWPWPIKATAIVLTSVFYGVSYFAFQGLLGWPARGVLPDRFRLIAADIREPNRKEGDEGEIYLWITDWNQPDMAPRAYRMDYDGRVHELIEQARTQERQGTPQVGERTGAGQGDRSARGGAGIRFTDQPRRALPPK
jgi:hypothetical protein